MTQERMLKHTCKWCNKEFDVKTYSIIDVGDDSDLRETIIDGNIFEFICPHCGEKAIVQYPFIYYDRRQNFLIVHAQYGELFAIEKMLISGEISQEYNIQTEGFTICAAPTYDDLITKIVCFENGLEHKTLEIYRLLAVEDFKEQYKDKKIVRSYVGYDGTCPAMTVKILENGEEQTYRSIIDIEEYEEYKNRHGSDLERVYDFIFDQDSAFKMVSLIDPEDKADALKQINHMATVKMVNQDCNMLVLVPEFNNGKYKEGDIVIIGTNEKTSVKAYITGFIQMSEFASPISADSMPYIMWKAGPKTNINLMEDIEDIENDELREKFDLYIEQKWNNKYMPKDTMMDSDVLIGYCGDLKDKDFRVRKYQNGDIMLCVYLEESDGDDGVKLVAASFDDIIMYVLDNPEKLDGIVINPNSQKILMGTSELFSYKNERLMANYKRMVKVLESLTKEEIEYIDEDCYRIICKVYYEGKTPKEIAQELEWEEDLVHQHLTHGYGKMIHVVRDNY